MTEPDIVNINRRAWNKQSHDGASPWVQMIDAEAIASARRGDWSVILTPTQTVPRSWFNDIVGKEVLCLASGGGQQAPVFAAAGAHVTSFDNSDSQLEKDKQVAEREGLKIELQQGDMADLSRFADASFDLIFHPTSNVFVADVKPVWLECARVLRPAGRLLAGFMNPSFYLFDHQAIEQGQPLTVKFKLPYADTEQLDSIQIQTRVEKGLAIEFSHSLEDQIGAQIAAGLVIAGFYEDHWDDEATPLNAFMPTSMATLAIKLKE